MSGSRRNSRIHRQAGAAPRSRKRRDRWARSRPAQAAPNDARRKEPRLPLKFHHFERVWSHEETPNLEVEPRLGSSRAFFVPVTFGDFYVPKKKKLHFPDQTRVEKPQVRFHKNRPVKHRNSPVVETQVGGRARCAAESELPLGLSFPSDFSSVEKGNVGISTVVRVEKWQSAQVQAHAAQFAIKWFSKKHIAHVSKKERAFSKQRAL